MLDTFFSAEADALAFFGRLPELFLGALFAVACILAARLVLRAVLCSLFGEEGSALAALAEVAAAFTLGLKFYDQPGVVLVLLGYFAAVGRVLAAAL